MRYECDWCSRKNVEKLRAANTGNCISYLCPECYEKFRKTMKVIA